MLTDFPLECRLHWKEKAVNTNRLICTLSALVIPWLLVSVTAAEDWPQFRFGANRGAASPEMLAAQLHLQWVREPGTPSPAFPGELRLRYDAVYEPVVMGRTIYVPSMVTDAP